MARALALAESGRGRTSPNPMVGAVVVDDEGVIVGAGAHEQAGGPHAEVFALAEAGGRARGATLYCTLEPCSHTGRTPPCAPLVAAAGIRRAVIAIEDPNPLVGGRGVAWLRERGVEVSIGLLRHRAERLNAPFLTRMRQDRPFVTAKIALSRDGQVAARPGARTSLTGPSANRFIHRERAEVDAIGVGSGTILTDDPLLTARGAYRSRPLTRVIFDRSLRTPPAARILSTLDSGPIMVMTAPPVAAGAVAKMHRLVAVGATIEIVGGEPAGYLEGSLSRLAAVDITSIVLEGGPTLHASAWRAGLVDRVQMFMTPTRLGEQGVPWSRELRECQLHDLERVVLGEDVMVEGYVHRAD